MVEIDLLGVVYGAEAALPALRRAGGGAVMVTASLAGLSPMPGDPGYSVAKAGAVAFVRSMAAAAGREGITITAICPGFADTAIIDPMREHFDAAGFPVLTADEVAAAMEAAWTSGEPGAAYVVQPGVGCAAVPVPGRAERADGGRRDRPAAPGAAATALTAHPRQVHGAADLDAAMAVFPVHRRTRMGGRDPHEPHRAATPLELLFDLTFVVAFGIAANELAHFVAEGHIGAGLTASRSPRSPSRGRGSTSPGSPRPTTPTTGSSGWPRWCRWWACSSWPSACR